MQIRLTNDDDDVSSRPVRRQAGSAQSVGSIFDLGLVGERPDLIVVGINYGYNRATTSPIPGQSPRRRSSPRSWATSCIPYNPSKGSEEAVDSPNEVQLVTPVVIRREPNPLPRGSLGR